MLKPFGCGWFIREFLLGNRPMGSPPIDLHEGAPQADIFYRYRNAMLRPIALDRATREEEKLAKLEKRHISAENIERTPESTLP